LWNQRSRNWKSKVNSKTKGAGDEAGDEPGYGKE
jgi:hypothetical protein